MAALKASVYLFEPKHFVDQFLTHALGSFAGALVTALRETSHKLKFTLAIGLFFLLGGTAVATMLPVSLWFYILDLVVASIPMVLFGATIGGARKMA